MTIMSHLQTMNFYKVSKRSDLNCRRSCLKYQLIAFEMPNNDYVRKLKKKSNKKDFSTIMSKIVSEYDQEIPQSQTADNPVAPRGRAAQPSRDTRKTN